MKRFALLPLLLSFVLAAAAQDTNYYVLRSDLAAYAERADLDSYATHSTLSNYSLTSDLTAYATLADLAGFVTSSNLANYALLSDLPATIAAYLSTNPPIAAPAVLTNYALRSDLSAYAPLSALAGFLTSSNLANYVLASDLSAYATASDLDGFATDEDIADFATLSNLYSAVSSALSSVSNSFLRASPRTVGTNTTWDVNERTSFNRLSFFDAPTDFEDDATFNGSVTFGVETRTNWNEHSSRTVAAGGSVTAAPNDHIIWAFPEPGNGVSVYLPDLTTNPISRTIIVRDFSGDNTATTTVYNVNATDTVTISAHESAVFDWCPEQFEWYPR